MTIRVLALAISLLFLIACSRNESTSAPFVDPARVATVLLARTPAERDACEGELRASGAKVLYKSDSGLLMTDKPAAALSLSRCRASVTSNETLQMTPLDDAPKVDLPTLLRLIPAEEIGARSFVSAHPDFDGRKVTIAILDTGIELDHPMLKKTSDGQDKVVAFHDLSGEGHVDLAPLATPPTGITGTDFRSGTFKGSTLKYAEALAKEDKFRDVGILVYKNSDGKWRGRIDTNADGSFADETELWDYSDSRVFVKLGDEKSLTVSMNIADDGSAATLCFDDGSHGTHVAGIAAGYDPKGLQGVAPGARVISAKIGDNRLAGGSTTTASMLLAIDYAVKMKAQIVNMSYGFRAGSNLGRAAVERYIDKVAREKGMIFSVSAGNEGPGLLTVGTPAGARLAISNAAFISKQTARDNYGYLGVEDDNTWYFSSVGPLFDGGWKPTLLAPGTALSSVPNWSGGTANYKGTSMASPHVTGGLALVLSAAIQQGLPTDRASITRAVYSSATHIPQLSWIEQGHGLMNVNKALAALTAAKGTGAATEYKIAVNSPTSPNGKGKGIYVRSRTLPSNVFTVTVTPNDDADDDVVPPHTYKLVPSAPWITVPANLWLNGTANSFQAQLDPDILKQPGLHSEKISAIDEASGAVAFEVPVTVVSPLDLSDASHHEQDLSFDLKVGHTQRYFLDVPAGTTAVQVDLVSDGPTVWGQWLDTEGRKTIGLMDPDKTSPQPPLYGQAKIARPGVYELDVVAPPSNGRAAKVKVRVQAFSLQVTAGPLKAPGVFTADVVNSFEPLKLTPKIDILGARKLTPIAFTGDMARIPFTVTADDVKQYSKIKFATLTAKEIYDLMTDFPFRVFDKDNKLVASGGLQLKSDIDLGNLSKLTLGDFTLELSGSFTSAPPASWSIELTEERVLKSPVAVYAGDRVLVETGQAITVPVDLSGKNVQCATLTLSDGTGREIQKSPVCF